MPGSPLTQATVVARSEGLLDVTVGGSLVVHDPVSDRYVRLNETGAALWRRLARPASLADLAGLLAADYGIERDRAERDAEMLVASLLARELARVVPEGGQLIWRVVCQAARVGLSQCALRVSWGG